MSELRQAQDERAPDTTRRAWMEMRTYQTYFQAERYINEGLIRTVTSNIPNKLTRREWMLKFLDKLNHPEKAYPAIHIAGTSGKGSTALLIATALQKIGLKVGLHTTPYLQVATEKLWINGKYASSEEFIDLVNWIRPICEKFKTAETPMHGLASFGLCLEYFKRQNIDIAVIETGVGGRDDITNVLKTELAVITPLGIDHTLTLGNSIESIATHKAGIIKPGKPVVAYRGAGSHIIETTANKLGSSLHWIEPADGPYQNTNAAIARKALDVLGYNNVDIDSTSLPARMEKLQSRPNVILDGAHNYQKLEALFNLFTLNLPGLSKVEGSKGNLSMVRQAHHERGAYSDNLIILFGMLGSKMTPEIVRMLRIHSNRIILTKPHVYGKDSCDLNALAKKLGENVMIKENSEEALEEALQMAGANDTIVVTGSLYLAGNIRNLYYPKLRVLKERNSFANPPLKKGGGGILKWAGLI